MGWTWYTWVAYYIPIMGWIRTYQWKNWLMVRSALPRWIRWGLSLRRGQLRPHCPLAAAASLSRPQWDVAAGLSVAAMVIPQGLSYANIAGLPNVYGLYGSFVPCMIYALFGTSKQLVGAPRGPAGARGSDPRRLGTRGPRLQAQLLPPVPPPPLLRTLPPFHLADPAPLATLPASPAGGGPRGGHLHAAGQRPRQHPLLCQPDREHGEPLQPQPAPRPRPANGLQPRRHPDRVCGRLLLHRHRHPAHGCADAGGGAVCFLAGRGRRCVYVQPNVWHQSAPRGQAFPRSLPASTACPPDLHSLAARSLAAAGWVTNFLSTAVVSGFMTGAATIIALGQVKYILGISYKGRINDLQNLNLIFDNLGSFQWREFCMGMAFIMILLAFQWLSRSYK